MSLLSRSPSSRGPTQSVPTPTTQPGPMSTPMPGMSNEWLNQLLNLARGTETGESPLDIGDLAREILGSEVPTPEIEPPGGGTTPTPEVDGDAEAYNRAHTPEVVRFDRATGGRYAKINGELDAQGVAAWQAERGLPATGRVTPETVAAAEGRATPETVGAPENEAA